VRSRYLVPSNVHNEGRAPLLRASLSIVLLDALLPIFLNQRPVNIVTALDARKKNAITRSSPPPSTYRPPTPPNSAPSNQQNHAVALVVVRDRVAMAASVSSLAFAAAAHSGEHTCFLVTVLVQQSTHIAAPQFTQTATAMRSV